MSQDHFPSSYRFYDPVIQIINENMKPERHELYNLKRNMLIQDIGSDDKQLKFKRYVGMMD